MSRTVDTNQNFNLMQRCTSYMKAVSMCNMKIITKRFHNLMIYGKKRRNKIVQEQGRSTSSVVRELVFPISNESQIIRTSIYDIAIHGSFDENDYRRMEEACSTHDWTLYNRLYMKWFVSNQTQQPRLNPAIIPDSILHDYVNVNLNKNYKGIIRLYYGFSEKRQEITIVVIADFKNDSRTHSFKGLPIVFKEWRGHDEETLNIKKSDESRFYCFDDKIKWQKVEECIKTNSTKLMTNHSNLEIVSASPYRSQQNGEKITKQTCIVLYCSRKGIIPFGEVKFPDVINDIDVDVREGFFYPNGNGNLFYKSGYDYQKSLLMGCNISSCGKTKSGTLGGFVEIEDGDIAFITCAHIFNDIPVPDEPTNREVVQPGSGIDGVEERENICGHWIMSACPNRTHNPEGTTVDAALVRVKEHRKPDRGHFVGLTKEALERNGFHFLDGPPEYTGELREEISPEHRHKPIFKCGSGTGLTNGKLHLIGTSVKYTDYEITYSKSKEIRMCKQYEVIPPSGSLFSSYGDSGALVFQLDVEQDHETLVGIGILIGCTSTNTGIVTPIRAVLDGLNLTHVTQLYTFPQQNIQVEQ